MKIKLFVTCEIQYFELRTFSFNSYVYYLTRGFIASTRAFNLLTRTFNLPNCAFNYATRAFRVPTRGFELVTCEFELVTRVLLFHAFVESISLILLFLVFHHYSTWVMLEIPELH